jgi:DNA polymerase-3 subunit beta
MKLSCLEENLSKGLGIVGRAVATHSTLPITNNVLLSADESGLKLAATNMEMVISIGLVPRQRKKMRLPYLPAY